MSNPFSVSKAGGGNRKSRGNPKNYGSRTGKRVNAAVTKYGNRGRSLRPTTITVRVPRNMSGTAQESKYFDYVASVNWPAGAGVGQQWKIMETTGSAPEKYAYLNYIAGGTSVNNRIGNKIHIKKLVVKLHVKFMLQAAYDNTSGENNQKIKFALILDQQANGGVPTTFPWDTTTAPATLDFMAFTKADNTRFRILKTKVIQRQSYPYVNAAGSALELPANIHELTLKHKFAGDGLVMTFDSNTAGVPRDNALYLVACSNLDNVGAANVDLDVLSRLYFKG